MTVNLTGVTDVQKIIVTLSDVTSDTSQVLPDTAAPSRGCGLSRDFFIKNFPNR